MPVQVPLAVCSLGVRYGWPVPLGASPDPTAGAPVAGVRTRLGVGIANRAAAFDPGTFVIGGGLSAAGDLLLTSARETFKRQLTGRGYRPEARIVVAQLGNDAGLIGAADLARWDVESQVG